MLASKRLDAYVSVLKWALELAQIPVAPELVNFLGEVARRRADPDMVPGLAAQIPDSPLIQWLHATDKPIKGDLRVVAGDLEGNSVATWVKTLLSDAFFWTDNDLVVQTRSMYGGSPREKDSTFVLDQGGKVSHFNYFSNLRTASAIVNALALTADPPDEFRVIGPLSWSGKSSTGVRAALPSRGAAAGRRAACALHPAGIARQQPEGGNDRIWLGWRLVNGFDRLAYDPKSDHYRADGPIGIYYDDLATFFFDDHDVKPFAFDWRRPIAAEAKRLADEVAAALDARKTSKQPVRIIAHSMGGLVARTMQIVSRSTWDRMMAADGARILMLGTPNGGSWAPMQVLSGDDTFGNLLVNVGAPFRRQRTRAAHRQFPRDPAAPGRPAERSRHRGRPGKISQPPISRRRAGTAPGIICRCSSPNWSGEFPRKACSTKRSNCGARSIGSATPTSPPSHTSSCSSSARRSPHPRATRSPTTAWFIWTRRTRVTAGCC